LTGINLGRYGLDLNPPESLKSLIESLEKIKSNIRIRLTSIEPMEIDESLILAIARSRKICHHLHIPLQSGDDEILKRMKRPYTSVDFLERIWMAFREIQDLTVGFDLIAGFPGEEDHHFERTYNFVEGLPFTYLHVFPFSPRKNTEAVSLSGKIPYQRTRERVNALRRLSMERKLKVYRENIGKIHDVLVEGEVEGGIFQGLTSNYLRVYFRGTRDMVNDIVPVKIESVEGERLVGKVNL
jgi:threonylcarbamoyladenosine tRNA methylthiotransferase MtaB